jgi:RNA polymerase sigma-70 factor (ECF subfamily)
MSTESFESAYREHFAFVWRALARLGVADAGLEDAAQDVFLVAYRRWDDFEGRSTRRTWIYGIAVRVARDHRRRVRRKGPGEPLPEELASEAPGPDEAWQARRAQALARQLLGRLDDERRELVVLVDLEGLSVPEAAELLGLKLNTAYSRLRLAHQELDRAAQQWQARVQREVSHAQR